MLKTLDHPNIIKIFDVYEDYNSVYIIMEFCHGKLHSHTKLCAYSHTLIGVCIPKHTHLVYIPTHTRLCVHTQTHPSVGGELLDRIVQAQSRCKILTEKYVMSLMHQILQALAYFHSRRVLHK